MARAIARRVRPAPATPPDEPAIGRAPVVHMLDLYPETQGVPVPMGDVEYRIWNMDPLERFCIGAIARLRQPATVFEIGTYDGATTLLLARAVPTAQVYTLDLPPALYMPPDAYGYPLAPSDPPGSADEIGSKFRGTAEAERIIQLHGDSRTFDFSEYIGRMDLVLVDARHEYEFVNVDTENALRMAGDDGVVVWDDYDIRWPGVLQAVDEAADRHGEHIARIERTDLAVRDPSRHATALDRR